jgi:xanthine dehydrogenase YagR molybdenum-binding subunit
MADPKWPETRRLIGKKHSRLDGPVKATGNAKYSYDINRKGMLYAMILRCPHAHAKIKSIDTTAAEKTPGFKAMFPIAKAGQECYYAGEEIIGIAADTEEHAADCIRAVKVDYEVLEHMVTEEECLKERGKKTVAAVNVSQPAKRADGNVEDAFKAADAVVEGTYGLPVQTHVCFETHGMVAEWEGDDLTVWASTQAVPGVADQLTVYFRGKGIPGAKTRCITHYMGAGYGSKFQPGTEGRVCAELARAAKAPVKLFLDRADEHVAGGNRPSAVAKIKISGTKDGKITGFANESYGTGGNNRGADPQHAGTPYVYKVPAIKNEHLTVYINAGGAAAMRAPGHPQYCFVTESAVDDLCNKLGLNPMDVRMKQAKLKPHIAQVYEKELELARELSGWDKKWHPPGKGPGTGPVKHGIGMALHTWGGAGNQNNDVRVTISSDGSVVVQCSTQDLGTGERTVLPIVIAEVLGLEVKDITPRIGESVFGRSTGSGGSTTCPGTSPAALIAGLDARDKLFQTIAGRLGAQAADLSIDPAKPGKIIGKDKEWSWKEACAKLGMDKVEGVGNHPSREENQRLKLSGMDVGGVQVAEVLVDTETGVVRCTKIVAVQDCGMIINKLCCESQVAGGVIMGVDYALFEDRIMDRHTGRQVNPDVEFYKLGGIQDMPEIVVHMHDMPERGVIGIGEPPTISTAAAIGNAVCNAIGVRVPMTPFTPDKILAALAQKGGA